MRERFSESKKYIRNVYLPQKLSSMTKNTPQLYKLHIWAIAVYAICIQLTAV